MIKFALFGAGFTGEIYGNNIAAHPRAELHYVYDVNTPAELLSAAIKAGKPVYCEKPSDLDIERVKAVVQEGIVSKLPILIG